MDQELPYYSSPPKMNKKRAGCLSLLVATFYVGLCALCAHANVGLALPQAARVAMSTQVASTPTQLSNITTTPTAMPTQKVPTQAPTQPPVPTQAPTQPPASTQPPSHQITYDFNASAGGLVYSPPANFCTTHICASNFQTDNRGYVVQCADGRYSHLGGLKGACSRNGGVAHILYMHSQ